MARALQLILVYILAVFLFSGCAAGPGKRSQPLTPAQKAANAIEVGDYGAALKHFDKLEQSGEEMQDEYRYEYGLALIKAGRYEEAIRQFSIFIDAIPRNHNKYNLALLEKDRTENIIRQQQQERQRIAEVSANLDKLSEIIERNRKQVQQQMLAGNTTFIEPLTGIEMILIAGGCYEMGDHFKVGRADELPLHDVCVDSFYLGKHEVTQGQWATVMGYSNASNKKGDQYPVEMVSWQEAMEFAKNLSGSSGSYRLPTEAEWEYAARSGGKIEKYSGSNSADTVAWHENNSAGSTHPVGQKQANGLGLHDMSGNVYEWCLDHYLADYYQASPKQNPSGPTNGELRTRRGGSWDSEVSYSRTSYRTPRPETARHAKTGFRLALPLAE